MLTPKQTRIFGAFIVTPYKEFTYKEIKEYSKEKSNSLTQNAINAFTKEELIIKKTIGNMLLYSLNLENEAVFSYFSLIISEQLPKTAKLSLKILSKETRDITFLSTAIFGSYVNNTHTEKSDLDIVLLVNSEKEKKTCELSIKSVKLKSILNIDAQVFTKNEMLQMFKDKDENLGKQIAKKHLAIHNQAIFYSIINEGINNGLKIIY